MSKRSRFITFVQAATKSCTNFSRCIRARVDLGQGPENGVRAEDQIDTRGGPQQFTCLAVTPFEDVLGLRRRLPHRSHVEQVHEEVVGQSLRRFVKTPCWVCPKLVDRARMPPTRTVISGAVSVSNCARSTSSSSDVTENLVLR